MQWPSPRFFHVKANRDRIAALSDSLQEKQAELQIERPSYTDQKWSGEINYYYQIHSYIDKTQKATIVQFSANVAFSDIVYSQ